MYVALLALNVVSFALLCAFYLRTKPPPRAAGTYEYFVDDVQIFTKPIPRALWKDKPIRLFYLFDYGYLIGMTRSLPDEGWTQPGVAGVAIRCAIRGWIYNATCAAGRASFKPHTT